MTSPIRSPSHLAFVRRQRCWFCQTDRDVVAHHHSKKYGGGGTGMRGCDLLTVPLCSAHHDEWHSRAQIGDLTTTETQREMWKGMALTLRAWVTWKRVEEAAEEESGLEP
jgi:hypothetical protein